MAKMSMQQELETLRAEVERLKQKQAEAAEQTNEVGQADVDGASSETHGFPSAEALLADAPEMAKELGQQLKGLAAQIEEEYDNLSPTIAVLIFAVGALFGRSLSSK